MDKSGLGRSNPGGLADLAEPIAAAMRRLSANDAADLVSIARALGVAAILSDLDLREDGRVDWQSGGPIVTLRGGMSAARRRFTLAHELAHVVLSDPESGPFHRGGVRAGHEERLCDLIAAAVLIPKETVERLLPVWPPSLEQVIECATESGASLSAVTQRVSTIRGRPLMLLLAREEGDSWAVRWTCGGPRWMSSPDKVVALRNPVEDGQGLVGVSRVAVTSASGPVIARGEALLRRGSLLFLADACRRASCQELGGLRTMENEG